MQTLVFYAGLAILLAHELDAMSQSEWQLLFILRKLPDDTAKTLFVLLHIPLTIFLLWLTHHHTLLIQQWARSATMLFLIVHTALHARLSQHPKNTFHSLLSTGLIYGGGMIGTLYCLTIL